MQNTANLGQHFLYQEKYLQKIIQTAHLSKDDFVLEIGSGTGSLTQKIIQKAGLVWGVEIDPQLAQGLKEKFKHCANLKIIPADFLKIKQLEVSKQKKIKNFKVIGSLPYYITGKILRKVMGLKIKIIRQEKKYILRPWQSVLVLQKEVGEKICHPQKNSLLSLSIKIFGKPEIKGIIPAQAFSPPPKVDSAILQISFFKKPLIAEEKLTQFFRLLKISFSAPRKMLKNNLKNGLQFQAQTIEKLLAQAKIPLKARAEELRLKQWIQVFQKISSTSARSEPEPLQDKKA